MRSEDVHATNICQDRLAVGEVRSLHNIAGAVGRSQPACAARLAGSDSDDCRHSPQEEFAKMRTAEDHFAGEPKLSAGQLPRTTPTTPQP